MRFSRIIRVIGVFVAVTGLVVCPPIASFYALGPLHPDVIVPLWGGSAVGLALGFWLAATARSRRPGTAALLLPIACLVWFEVLLRIGLSVTSDATARELAWLAERTHPEGARMVAHPFLQFTGRSESALRGNEFYGNLTPFNEYGFLGKAVDYEKADGVVRVACLGGSTTARGYPEVAERILNAEGEDLGVRFEVLNFGMGFWTSAHTLCNFVLNVVEFEPDFVVVLHGWNDQRVLRARKDVFRPDYSHAFKTFEPPPPPDRWLIRASVAYRWIANELDPSPQWSSMLAATMRPYPHTQKLDIRQCEPFVRNLRTIAQLSVLRGAVPVLVTMPHCTDPSIPFYDSSAKDIEMFANITRMLHASELRDIALLVDLDAQVTGKRNDLFVDVGHMTKEGVEVKARAVAETILDHMRSRR